MTGSIAKDSVRELMGNRHLISRFVDAVKQPLTVKVPFQVGQAIRALGTQKAA